MGAAVELTDIASGLRFPEGPIAMPDGAVVFVEMFAERLARVDVDGTVETVAHLPGGPNGAAVGPDGAFYVCNNGRAYTPLERDGLLYPGPIDRQRYLGGRVQRVDAASGAVSDLYTECAGRPLRSPNDLVMDGHGGFWFTDHGIRDVRGSRTSDFTAIYYARCDGSSITEGVYPSEGPNGIALSPDGTVLYWAETHTGRVFRRTVTSPGEFAPSLPGGRSEVLCGLPGFQLLDSMAVDGAGFVCVATLVNGGVTAISADGTIVEHIPTGDPLTTNICFGGSDGRTAFLTLSGTGRVASMPWPRPGHRLAHQ